MRRALQITARIVDGAGRPVRDLKADAQVFHRQSGWRSLAEGATNDDGKLNLRTTIEDSGDFAPALRLARSGTEPAEVLAQVASFATARVTLQADFGEVTLLPGPGLEAPGVGARERAERVVGTNSNLVDLLSGGSRTEHAVSVYREMLTVETAKREQLETRLGLREARIQELSQDLDAFRSERDDLADAVETLRRSEESSPTVASLTGAMSGALDQARKLGGMELSNAEIRLRGIVSEAGTRFHPLDAAEARNLRPENVSELVLRLNAPRPAEAPAAHVPDLLGQTVGRARRAALAVGLELDVVEEVIPGRPAGAIIAQVPDPGAEIGVANGRLSVVVAVPPLSEKDRR